MFASLVMSTRGKPRSVWLGAAAAFVVHVAIAVTVGVALFHLLPHRAVDGLVAAMFLVGAGLALREATGGARRTHRRARGGLEPAGDDDRIPRHLLAEWEI